jgi:circadian clock protein KaiC
VLLLDDRTAETAQRQLESIAHGVINLEYVPTEYGKQRHNMRVVKMRGINFQSGSHDFNIETGGIIVFPRLGAPEVKKPFEPGTLHSNLDDLEQLIGGLDYGTSTILTGPAGIGKSTISLMYAHTAAKKGERSAVYLFDENVETLYQRTSALGLDVKKYVEAGLISIRQIKLAELTPGELAHLVRQEVEQNDTRLVIIDSVNGYLMSTPQERFLKMQFHELLGFLNRKGVISIIIVGQFGLIGNMQSPIDMSYLADTVVLLRYFEAGGEVRQAISVLKKRTGEHERTIREFRIDKGGIRLGQPLKDFQGVLTGVPVYHGKGEGLMERNGSDDSEGK